MATKQKEPLIDRDEVAAILGVHSKTVERYVRQGKLPAYKVGLSKKLWFKRSEVEDARSRVTSVK